MLSIADMTYHIGDRVLYEKTSLSINLKDKIGLVGLNGKGKSTLLKIINGDCTPEKGHISKAKEYTIGFLNQDTISLERNDSILSVAMEAFREAVDIQNEINSLIRQLETSYTNQQVNRLADLQEKFEQEDGYTIQAKAAEILEGIGFSSADLQRPLKQFSGGWRMRVTLAKLLLEKPSLLMLDEPTNHLDLPSIKWVENYLQNYSGAIIVVSHDRAFLDRVTTKTVEVANCRLTSYEGNYSFYVKEKKLRDSIQQKAYINQQKNIKQTERFIERFRSKATKARQVQSRVKALQSMDRVEDVVQHVATMSVKFSFEKNSGKQVITLSNLSKSYPAVSVFNQANATIERGDKIALIGSNGKGKSTLLRIIAGNESIDSGNITPGYNLVASLYAQHQLEVLRPDNELLEELKQVGSKKTEQELRNVLGCFLFSDEDVFKKIKVLSGGEKSRVALAKTLISEANFLILDEPTNHLDFLSENILIEALKQYQGSFIVVSHNRHFISQVATKIWCIENQQIKEYPGRYEEYEHKQSLLAKKVHPSHKAAKAIPQQKKNNIHSSQQKTDKQLNKWHNELKHVEQTLEQVQQQKMNIEAGMATPEVYEDIEKATQMNGELKKVKKKIEDTFKEWEKIAEKIDRKKAIKQ